MDVIALDEIAVYHCVNRCVRRAYLCGRDGVTGQSFEHRREWIRARLEFLAGQFAIEVLGFAVMSNHLHVILRGRPDVVAAWTDDDVARRWWMIFPQRRDEQCGPAEPTAADLAMLQLPERLATFRRRLCDVSWFMRCLAEPIARRANREDQCSGRFWEGRFKCQPLLDEAAIAACSVYVDLNPIRAGIASTPECSEYTSAHERIHAAEPRAARPAKSPKQSRKGQAAGRGHGSSERQQRDVDGGGRNPSRDTNAGRSTAAPGPRDGWLSPVELNERSSGIVPNKAQHGTVTIPCGGGAGSFEKGERANLRATSKGPSDPTPPTRRASHRGFLPMSERQYLELLDWTGRQVRRDKRGAIPADVAPLFDRLQLSRETWVETVQHFGRWFRRAAGRPSSLAAEAARRSRRWLAGISHSREAFG
jgi:REP element-mobilizing transposase RayT